MAQRDDADFSALRELRRQASIYRPPEPGEEQRLLRRSALGDRSSEDRLVAANLGLVIRLAGTRGEQGLSLSDLVQEGLLGLVAAVRTFAESGRIDFVAFAEQKVTEHMDEAIAAEAVAVRDAQLLVAAATDFERAEFILGRELHREATVGEIAEKLEWTVERARYVGQVVADARLRHDEELMSFIDPDDDAADEDERAEFDA